MGFTLGVQMMRIFQDAGIIFRTVFFLKTCAPVFRECYTPSDIVE